jgi:hypothetical protein
MDVPARGHHLFYLAISPERDFRFAVATSSGLDYIGSVHSGREVALNVWTHIVFTQQVDANGQVERRTLYLDGQELVSSNQSTPSYNPAPVQVGAVSTSLIRALIQTNL